MEVEIMRIFTRPKVIVHGSPSPLRPWHSVAVGLTPPVSASAQHLGILGYILFIHQMGTIAPQLYLSHRISPADPPLPMIVAVVQESHGLEMQLDMASGRPTDSEPSVSVEWQDHSGPETG
jgi:hypothetical protein